MAQVEIKIPDIGDSENVEVIEILVATGDTIEAEQSLVTLESDKASMEVPAEKGGKIASLSVSVGDTVNSGDVIGMLDVDGGDAGGDAGGKDEDGAAAGGGSGGGGKADGDDSPTPNSGAAQRETEGVDPAGGDTTGARSTTAHSTGVGASSGAASGSASAGGGSDAPGGSSIDVSVPDIGEASDVEVIEVLVSVGDTVEIEQSLVTLESDKASMEVPSPAAGTVESITVAVGDSVDEGSPLLVLKSAEGGDSGGGGDEAAASGESAGAWRRRRFLRRERWLGRGQGRSASRRRQALDRGRQAGHR